ncbi:MAG: hypothetical protein K2P65_00905, partial [Lachnospiraceae bacterium]|nr:hypothetical protein [Lachnospiraceae bacterium]
AGVNAATAGTCMNNAPMPGAVTAGAAGVNAATSGSGMNTVPMSGAGAISTNAAGTGNTISRSLQVMVNGQPIRLEGKTEYIFVDVFDYIDFDLSVPQGSGIATELNGRNAQYMEPINSGDVIKIYWKD